MTKKKILKALDSDKRHGGAYDRGGADYYYGRGRDPHFYVGGSMMSPRVNFDKMTVKEVEAYDAGYADAEAFGDRKDWR